jgi:propionyl-CoA synthetase
VEAPLAWLARVGPVEQDDEWAVAERRSVGATSKTHPTRPLYSTFDSGIRDRDGYYFVLGRTDDVINVAGHRLGTREIEESLSSHPNVAEVAVTGMADSLKTAVTA